MGSNGGQKITKPATSRFEQCFLALVLGYIQKYFLFKKFTLRSELRHTNATDTLALSGGDSGDQ
jgi:hypothetical protein